MNNKQHTTYKWAYLPFVFSSAAVLVGSVAAAPGASQQYQDAKQVNSANYEYVGGRTQLGLGVTDDGDASVDINHIFSETQNSSTSGGLWAGYDLSGDDKGIQGRGAQLNHNWVSRDGTGRATHVNKVFGAYDRNKAGHAKATVGYGQENENLFWDVHTSKGLSGKKDPRTINGKVVRDKGYDYGVGANVGTFLKGSNVRIRAGLDHEWGEDVGAGESNAKNTTLSAGIEKFFQGTPHSLGLDVAASKRSGGYDNGSDDSDVSGKLTYRYDFGGASIYQPDRRYKRVRVEIPGKAVPPRYAKKAQFKRVPTYGTKKVRVPYKQLVKSTMALEGQTFFKLNSAKLIPSAQTRLKQIATQIRKNGYKGSIRITGNTCGLGDPVYDQRLSEQRARAVRAFLIKNGFNANHLIARGLGKGHPKYPNTPSQGFKNRRVDIEYVSEQKAFKTGYRTETRRVSTGFKNVPAGFKNVLIDNGRPGTPRVIWKTEVIPTSPAWIKRALHNNITHNTSVSTYQTTAGSTTTPTNVAPVALDDTKTISCSTAPVTINVLGNDKDADGDKLTITNVQNGQYGTTQIVNNQIVYTPDGSGCGETDSFEYTISDGNGHTTTATVEVNVEAANNNVAPVAVNDSATTTEGQPVTLTTLSNDSDADGDTLTIISVEDPANGTAVISGGEIIYTPDAGFTGTETFNYTISDNNGHIATATETVIVTPGQPTNVAPVASDDTTTIMCSMTGPQIINVLDNDSDADGDTLMIDSVGSPAYGTAEIVMGQIIYTPDGSGCGKTDSFEYTISDGNGHTSTATINVNVSGTTNVAPVAVDDVTTTTSGQQVALNTLSNDSDADGDTLTITAVQNPSHGTAIISGGQILYTPDAGFVGTDSFTYTISDGNGHTATATETVVVTAPVPSNVAPVAKDDRRTIVCSTTPVSINVLRNDRDDDGDTLTITDVSNGKYGSTEIINNRVVYTPNGKGCGKTDSFTYTITDGQGHSTTATVKVQVKDDDSGFGASDDAVTTDQDTAITIDVMSNDDEAVKITRIVENPSNGTVKIVNGKIKYTPDAGFSGVDTFDYEVKDAKGNTSIATVTVTVRKDQAPLPEANDDSATLQTCNTKLIDVLINDNQGSGNAEVTVVSGPKHGSFEIKANGKILYWADDYYVGEDSFTYMITDSNGKTSTATVNLTITNHCLVNGAPKANNDANTTWQGYVAG